MEVADEEATTIRRTKAASHDSANAAAADAVAGSAASDGDHVEYYLKTNEVDQKTRQCIADREMPTGRSAQGCVSR